MISMLLPARGRPQHLQTSIESVFSLASSPDDIEILVRLDECDPHLAEELKICNRPHVKTFVGAREGYAKMHFYYNGLAERATGQWLFLWNDDIEMLTPKWDELLLESPLFAAQWPRRDITSTTDYTLPVVGRPIYDALKHLSMNAYCDAWIADWSGFAGTSIVRDDIVFIHHRLNDDTLMGQQDGGVEWKKFSEEQQLAMRKADRDAVIRASGWADRFEGWNTEPIINNVDYIRLGGDEKSTSVVLKGRKK